MILNGPIYKTIVEKCQNHTKQLAVLIDPDRQSLVEVADFARKIEISSADYILVGSSYMLGNMDKTIEVIKENSGKPVIIFPGHSTHISDKADAILLLSLVSGRNPEFLIGNHVVAAASLMRMDIEVISTSYMLIDGGATTSVEYVSNTRPIPSRKSELAVATAVAGEMLGHKLTYLEAGSGALNPVPNEMIAAVRKTTKNPLIVGGGLRDIETINEKYKAGADIIVVGNAFENNELKINQFIK
ncbi:MAG: geranylgeranylglyceryl/heptaprenylglyceryl phosphate synthase [Bacteroidales bacterium]|nr:geranylgeranylglyceryl/heptaprenylglyceryl phosphate synthase [Bacteroidales bacterium]